MPDEHVAELHGLEEKDWSRLIDRIQSQECIPFVGPGFGQAYYSTKAQIAEKWSKSEGYPFDDNRDLARVAQFLTFRDEDELSSRKRLLSEFKGSKQPNFKDNYEPHRVLAHLPFPVYITTNYDDFLIQALKEEHKDPLRECCDWRNERKSGSEIREPSPANPMVYHLYGHTDDRKSLILTESDYMRFLLNMAKFEDLIPLSIQERIVERSLLFLGYQVDEWDFRILLTFLGRFFDSGFKVVHVAAQLTPDDANKTPEQRKAAREHFQRCLTSLNVKIYWGTVKEFTTELLNRYPPG